MFKNEKVSHRILGFWLFLKIEVPGSTGPALLHDGHQLGWAVAAHQACAALLLRAWPLQALAFVTSVLQWRQVKKTN